MPSRHFQWRKIAVSTAVAALTVSAFAAPAALAEDATSGNLTILATTDTHGNIYNYDYFKGVEYQKTEKKDDVLSLSHVKSIADKVRGNVGKESVLMVDNGDAIQGTPLTYLAAKQPEKFGENATVNPMARGFNLIEYDAQVVGNHEFNYSNEYLKNYEGQLNAPLLGANVLKHGTEEPWLTPYTMINKTVAGHAVKIGVIGVVTPGVRVWDKANVEGKLDFQDAVTAVQRYVPEVKAQGADVVVALVHSGLDKAGYQWNPADLEENVATSIATHVDGLDVVIGGHSHSLKDPSHVFHSPDGSPVLFSQPYYWARSVSQLTIPLTFEGETVNVAWPEGDDAIGALAKPIQSSSVEASPVFVNDPVLKAEHQATIDYVNSKVATSTELMKTETSRYEDTPILDFIGKVMTDTVKEGLAKTAYANLPIVAQVSPFSRTSEFPKGDVTIKNVAGLYIYDNTLMGMKMNGKQLKEYLEYSARYFSQVAPGAAFTGEEVTSGNDASGGKQKIIPDYNYDALTGVFYDINISQPATDTEKGTIGSRIENLRWPDANGKPGEPVKDTDEFILAVNNYRAAGGGGFPYMGNFDAVVYDEQVEIRQALIDYGTKKGTIDPKDFFVLNWKLTSTSASTPDNGNGETDTPATDENQEDNSAAATEQGSPQTPAQKGDLANTGSPIAFASLLAIVLMLVGAGAYSTARARKE